jgi:hypothetical protein
MKFDDLTIFLIILGILVVVVIFMNWTTKQRDTFVNFQNNQPPSYGKSIYIPQYSSDSTHTVLSLYDNLYFDTQNATLIEVYSPSCAPGQTTGCQDVTGASISEITVVPRDGLSLTTYPSGPLKPDLTVTPFSTPQSQQKSVNPAYNQFTYTTTCDTTDLYQVFYVSWYTNTYLHVVDLSGVNSGSNIKTFNLSATGLVDAVTYPTGSTLPPFTKSPPSLNDSNNNTSATDQKYLNGTVKLYQLAAETTSNAVIKALYDVTNGNIVINLGTGTYNVYNRTGTGTPSSQDTIKNNTPVSRITKTNTFIINDLPNVAILVLAYQYDTVIAIITSRAHENEYKMVYCYRFNQSGLVNNSSNDSENVSPTNAPTNAPTTGPSNSPTSSPSPLSSMPAPIDGSTNSSATLNSISNLNSGGSQTSNVCGDDLSCKWYWYFNTIAQHTNGVNYLSDDYFLKTEAIPPVCPQCPQCPTNGGACTNCGGNGGSGSIVATTAPSTASPSLTPATNPSLPPGAVTDNSGNTYIPYTDNSGNTRYVLYSNYQQGKAQNSKQGGTAGGKGGNLTAVDQNGQFITTSDPNTLGGGLAVSTMSLDQLGTAGFNTVGGFGNNVVNTAGNVVGGTVNSATNLVGGVANTAANLVGGVASGVTNLAGGIVGTAADLAKSAGSGLMHLGSQNGQYSQLNQPGGIQQQVGIQSSGGIQQQQGSQSTGSSLGYTPFGPTSDSTFGNMPGQTPIDNYSYYGATQSKGGNYMPITADFSAFGK